MKAIATRMETLTPHFFASLSAKIGAMQAAENGLPVDIIRLDEGNPDLPPAAAIIEALSRSASAPDHHGYQPHLGTRALREAWAEMYRREFGVDLDPQSEVLPLLGSKEGIFHLALALVEPGDIVLIPDPGYISYTRGALFAGGEPYYFPLLPERGYLPDLEAIPAQVLQKAKMLWLNYPNNPTAACATLEFFAQVVDIARQYELLVCHDAAYNRVTFNGKNSPSILQVPGAKEVTVEFNTLSKSHNMAGWRTGAAVGSPQPLRALYTLKTNADSGQFLPVIEAAVEALTGDQGWLAERNLVYLQRRDVVVKALRAMGLAAPIPDGSIYVWSPIPAGWSAVDFVTQALENAFVSLTPGTLFGKNGEGFVRISLTAPTGRIEEAMRRLAEWMEK